MTHTQTRQPSLAQALADMDDERLELLAAAVNEERRRRAWRAELLLAEREQATGVSTLRWACQGGAS